MASIAITGAGGRLGTRFLSDPEWLHRHECSAFSRRAGPAVRALEALGDPEVISRFDIVLHLAWSTVPKTAEDDPGRAGAVDLPLLERILESAAIAGEERPQPLYFIFFSTGAVYGNAVRDTGSIESDPAAPIGAYARGKRKAEKRIARYFEERKLRGATLRVSNAWGFPGNSGTPQGVIPHLIRASLDGTVFEQWGGDSEKDYLHVDDLSGALLKIFEQQPDGLFNVASGRSQPLSRVIRTIEAATGKSIRVKPGGTLPWDVSENRLSPNHFCETTGWKPKIDFADGIARLVEEMG